MEEKTNVCYHLRAAAAITNISLQFICKNMSCVNFFFFLNTDTLFITHKNNMFLPGNFFLPHMKQGNNKFLFTLFFNHFPQYFNALQKASLSLVQSHSKTTNKKTHKPWRHCIKHNKYLHILFISDREISHDHQLQPSSGDLGDFSLPGLLAPIHWH